MTVTAHNASEVPALIEFAEARGIGSVHFPQLVPVGYARANWESIALEGNAQVEIERYLLARSGSGQPSSTRVSANRIERIAAWLLVGEPADCLRTLSLRVTPDGKIAPCPTASVDTWSLGNIADRPQPERLLSNLEEQGAAIRRFSALGPDAKKEERFRRSSASCMRTCESCWLIGPPDGNIAEYGRRVNGQHMRDAVGEGAVDEERLPGGDRRTTATVGE
jgi:MoaA/NifB/PqqE/SkfB family radical SAM enzyme